MHIIRVNREDRVEFVRYLVFNDIKHTIFSVSVPWTQYCVKADRDTLLYIGLAFSCKIYNKDLFIRECGWTTTDLPDWTTT